MARKNVVKLAFMDGDAHGLKDIEAIILLVV
jgi:hypothetical protein